MKLGMLLTNGKLIGCHGVVTLPVSRKGSGVNPIQFHIIDAPVGFNLLLGTNALGQLGFKIFDSTNGEMIEFENSISNDREEMRVIFHTRVQPKAELYEKGKRTGKMRDGLMKSMRSDVGGEQWKQRRVVGPYYSKRGKGAFEDKRINGREGNECGVQSTNRAILCNKEQVMANGVSVWIKGRPPDRVLPPLSSTHEPHFFGR